MIGQLNKILAAVGCACVDCLKTGIELEQEGSQLVPCADGSSRCPHCFTVFMVNHAEMQGSISTEMADKVRDRVERSRAGEQLEPWGKEES